MRRILLVLTAAALLATMVMATAVPAFADPDLQGHETRDLSEGCSTGDACTVDVTRSGRFANNEGGPGRFTIEEFTDQDALFTPDPYFSESITRSGHTEDGGGRNTTDFSTSGDFKDITFDSSCVGSDD